ncbi:hypothetical protein JAAARDRAFT_443913 [Jaapia argillacea MUCL 33604]|uniref:Uncharacterized protein n=1 Tax=Jaapia argillacea MUCL 33604 TaxID=933084 RepID=A0A067PRU3_9AGAM|nr:hypothetical protein JAAARDRAFT_443913 [Jaapia argillacea MUCL 33604]
MFDSGLLAVWPSGSPSDVVGALWPSLLHSFFVVSGTNQPEASSAVRPCGTPTGDHLESLFRLLVRNSCQVS